MDLLEQGVYLDRNYRTLFIPKLFIAYSVPDTVVLVETTVTGRHTGDWKVATQALFRASSFFSLSLTFTDCAPQSLLSLCLLTHCPRHPSSQICLPGPDPAWASACLRSPYEPSASKKNSEDHLLGTPPGLCPALENQAESQR